MTCGSRDPFGVVQFCHDCNVRIYKAKIAAPMSAEPTTQDATPTPEIPCETMANQSSLTTGDSASASSGISRSSDDRYEQFVRDVAESLALKGTDLRDAIAHPYEVLLVAVADAAVARERLHARPTSPWEQAFIDAGYVKPDFGPPLEGLNTYVVVNTIAGDLRAKGIGYMHCRCGHDQASHNQLKFNCLATTDGTHATRCDCKAYLFAGLP
jgi:hypothetical protein